MKYSPAMLTPHALRFQRQIPIDFLQQLVYSPVSEYLLHVGPSPLIVLALRTKNLTELPQAP
jgi:hypothetical protein